MALKRERTIGEKIRDKRRNDGLTQQECGKILCVTGRTLSLWELGRKRPHPKNVANVNAWLRGEMVNGAVVIGSVAACRMCGNPPSVTVKTNTGRIEVGAIIEAAHVECKECEIRAPLEAWNWMNGG